MNTPTAQTTSAQSSNPAAQQTHSQRPGTFREWSDLFPLECRAVILRAAGARAGIVRSIGATPEDIVGEVFARLREKNPAIPDRASLEPFVYRCAFNLIYSAGRKRRTWQGVFQEEVETPDAFAEPMAIACDDSPYSSLATMDELDSIRGAVCADPKRAAVVSAMEKLIADGEKPTTRNIAARLGQPYGRVRRLRVGITTRAQRERERGFVGEMQGRPERGVENPAARVRKISGNNFSAPRCFH